jgi:hypothetical protein
MDSWVKTASTEVAFFVNGVKARACFPCLYFLVPFIPFTLSVHPSLSPAKGGREESSTRNDLPVLLEEPPGPDGYKTGMRRGRVWSLHCDGLPVRPSGSSYKVLPVGLPVYQ